MNRTRDDRLLPMLIPLVDLYALYGILVSRSWLVLVAWSGFLALQLALAAYAFRLDGESRRPLWAVPLQQFGQRQLMYLVIVHSVTSALLGSRLRWHKQARTGEVSVATS